MRAAVERLVPSTLPRAAAVAAAILAIDRATKWWAEKVLAERGFIAVVPFFHLTYVQNTGAAFGMMRGSNTGLALLSVCLLGVMFGVRRKLRPEDLWAHWGIVLVISGAVGNLYDRLIFGYVIDFLDFRVWPVFNVADSCISIGALALAFGLNQSKNN